MKSVLLGGLKVFLVNDGGKPLSAPGGRAKFYVAGTSTPATVYSDIDLTEADALGPVVYTDELGYLPAIWLKTDRLYKVRVEQKLPGNPDTWALIWEVDNVGYIDPHESEELGEETVSVNSIAALKSVDHSAHTEVMVNGYYTAGDWGDPSVFVWDGECTASADDGAFVRPNDIEPGESGRWIQIFNGGILDVRKFGALPDITLNADVTASVINAVNYSQRNSTRSRPITVGFVAPGKYEFSGNFDFSQYTFTDLSDNSVHQIKWFIGNDVVFVGNSSVFTLSKETICTATETLVTGATLHVQGGGGIKVDPAWWGNSACVVSDCYVECHSKTYNDKSFTRCTVTSEGMLGASSGNTVELHEMEFSEFWFVDTFQWSQLTTSDIRYGVHDCRSANSYVEIKNSQGDPNYGDIDLGTVTGLSLLSGAIVENAVFSGVSLTGFCKLNGVSGTVTLVDSPSVELVDCNISFSSTSTASSVVWRGGSTGGSKLSVSASMYAEGVEISSSIEAMDAATLTIRDCKVGASSTVSGGVLDVYGSDIRGTVEAKSPSSVMTAQICSNRFLGSGKFVISPTGMSGTEITPAVKVTGNFADHAFVDDSAFNGVTHTVGTGTFMYKDNYGGCPVTEKHVLQVIAYGLIKIGSGSDPRVLPTQNANTLLLLEDWRRNAGDSNNDVKRQIWWSLKLDYEFSPESNNMFFFKYFKMSRVFQFMPTCRCSFKNGQYGISANEIPVPNWTALAGPDAQTITKSGTYTMQQQVDTMYTNSDIDEKRSRLAVLLASAINPSGWDPQPEASITWNIYS